MRQDGQAGEEFEKHWQHGTEVAPLFLDQVEPGRAQPGPDDFDDFPGDLPRIRRSGQKNRRYVDG